MLIYHIVLPKVWEEFKDKDLYEADSLKTEGFIHCSFAEQLDAVVNRYYPDENELVILSIETFRLKAKVVNEYSTNNESYPHIYGEINLDAIVKVEIINPGVHRVVINYKHKSLDPLELELPSFVVLTGINGSGKTHFLEALNNTNLTDVLKNGIKLRSLRFIPSHSLAPAETAPHFVGPTSLDAAEILHTAFIAAESPPPGITKPWPLPSFEAKLGARNLRKVLAIATRSNKNVHELDLNDFKLHIPLDDANVDSDFLSQRFSVIFKHYWEKKSKNLFIRLKNESGIGNAPFLSDEEFKAQYGNPRDAVNGIIQAANLEYEFNQPTDENEDQQFVLKLKSKLTGNEIDLDELSSGEKVIMSLVFALYNSKLELNFPDVLLLDEPDASLHPSMTKQFLDVLKNDFVKAKNMQVIMTTHSPSTVALAPEDALFVMNKVAPRIEKSTKDKALHILTAGIPSLSVNYENRRQVFVESKNDVEFFDKFYEKLKNLLEPEISLTFISSGDSATDKNKQPVSNCEQVIKITQILRDAGNKSIFGIIDWDGKNKGSNSVKVLGKNQRYSIENFILDPVFLAALLLQEGLVKRKDIGLTDNETYVDFRSFANDRLQVVSDFVTNNVKPFVQNANDEVTNVRYLSERQIEIPSWYLSVRGHDLVPLVQSAFPGLSEFKSEGCFMKEIMNKYVENIPEFISIDILELLRSIQEA